MSALRDDNALILLDVVDVDSTGTCTSTRIKLDVAIPTDELADLVLCGCAEDVHRWSSPMPETVDTVRLTRWRCTCTHCRCDGLHLTVNPTDTGKPQHTAVDP